MPFVAGLTYGTRVELLLLTLTLNAGEAVVDVPKEAAAHAGPWPMLIKWLRLQLDCTVVA